MIKLIKTVVEVFDRKTRHTRNQSTIDLRYASTSSSDGVVIDSLVNRSIVVDQTDASSFDLDLSSLFDVAELKYLSVQCFLEKTDATTPNKALKFTVTHDANSYDTASFELIDVANMTATTFRVSAIQDLAVGQVARVTVSFATKTT